MDLLKQVEQKIQGLMAQRNQLMEELERVKGEHGGQTEEMLTLRGHVEALQTENGALQREREEVRRQVESILKQLEAFA